MLKKGVSLALGKHPLLAAVEAGNVEAADIIAYKILKTNIPLDAEGKTAVHYAACFGDVEMLDLLRKRGADFYKQDALGKTAFHYGFEQGWDTVVDYFLDAANEFELPKNLLYYIANIKASRHIKKLIDRGFDVNIMGRETGETPIFRAIQGNQYEAFVTLCAHGANLGIRAKSDRTPLLLAAELGLSAFVAYLLPLVSKEETTSDGKNALHLAAIAGHEKCVQYLQDQGLDQSTINSRFLAPHIAMILKGESQELRRHKKEMIKALKQEDVTAFSDWSEPFAFHAPMDFDIEGRMARLPIAHLIYRLVKPGEKRIEILESMERDFTIRDPKGDTLAHIQAMQEEEIDFEAVDPLAKNQAGVTILHLCAAHSIENLQGAILKCASVDVEDEQGFTPLYYAVLAGQLPHVRLILEKGANPNHMSKVRGSPLFYAVEKNWPAIVTLLLQYGADIDQVCSGQKTTCLLRALERELFYMARLLINLGANPKKADGDGLAPIHLAAYKGKTTLVRHLVYAGASLKAVDKRGWTLAHHAAESKESELLDYLRPSLLRERSQKGASSARYPVSMPRQTPLDIAARRGNVAMLKKLKEKGVHAEKAE
jgi:ankyrin repeat protein